MNLADALRHLPIRAGTPDDYSALKHHHYRSGRPGAITQVWAIDAPGQPLAPRWARICGDPGPGTPSPPAPAVPEVAAVLTVSLPHLACRLRSYATRNRYGTHLHPTQRAWLLNREVRCISRVVVDPRFRGLGLAVRLIRHALNHAHVPFVEALAAMGRVNPFFERAGMTRHDPTPALSGRCADAADRPLYFLHHRPRPALDAGAPGPDPDRNQL